MHRLDNNKINERIEQIENLLNDELKLDNTLNEIEKFNFIKKILPYLKHSRTSDLAGRRTETLESNLKRFVSFTQTIGLNEREIILSIENFPSIINSIDNDFIFKYMLLGMVENENNTLRKKILINNPRYFNTSLEVAYARYKLMSYLNYEPITFNNVMKSSTSEFAKIFVKTSYLKPYKIYDNEDQLSKDKLLNMFPINNNFVEEMGLQNLACNKNIVDYIMKMNGIKYD